jgi:hypothetical protein
MYILKIPGWTWKHNFAAALDSVVESAFRGKGSTYSQIQLLENDLRDQRPPRAISWPEKDEQAAILGAPGESSQAMQRYVAFASAETGKAFYIPSRTLFLTGPPSSLFSALLHLHRWFFLQAIRENPGNPFEHPFAHSVKTVLESSHALIAALHTIYQYQPAITATFRAFWIHAYSAAVRRLFRVEEIALR